MLRNYLIATLLTFCVLLSLAQHNVNNNTNKLLAKVSIQAEKVTLDAVFEQLSNQTGCYFTYNAEQINGNQLIRAEFTNYSLEQALDSLLKNPVLTYELVNNQLIIHPVSLNKPEQTDVIEKGKTISGIVMARSDNVPLPFASIVVKNTYFGAISNNNGEFTLRIPEAFLNDTLEFSFMGYHTKELTIKDINERINVRLKLGNVSLQEVIIRSIEPTELIRKARNSINNNYYDKPYNFEAFYREAVKKGMKYRGYSEALLHGYKPSHRSGNTTSRVQILKGRKYKNIQQTDTVLVKLRGGMEGCFQLDLIHDLPDFLQEQEVEIYDYNLDDISTWNNELVYVIGFKQKEFVTEPLFEGEIYITVDNHAILGSEFSFSKKMIRKTRNLFVVKKTRQLRIRPVSTTYKVQYSRWNGKYYTKHVRGELTFKAKKSRQLIHENYTTLMEMVYTQIDTVNVAKLERKKTFQTHTVFSDSDQIYDDQYWKESNIINPETDILQALKSSGFKVLKEGVIED